MLMTRRGVLRSAAALGTWPARTGKAFAADSEPVTVSVEAQATSQAAENGSLLNPTLHYGKGGPLQTIRVRRGEPFDLVVQNALDQSTSLQLHGLRGWGSLDDPDTRALSDVPAHSTRRVRVTPSDAGTAWFHPLASPADQTAQGLAGILIVDDTIPFPVDHDLTLLFGDLVPAPQGPVAIDIITVGHEPAPSKMTFPPGARLRLRLINGSTRRVMTVACSGAKPLIVAIDGQPSELFAPSRNAVPIAPGARFDWILDLPVQPDAVVRLVLRGPPSADGTVVAESDLVTLTTMGTALTAKPAIAALPPNPRLPKRIPLEAAKRIDLLIEGNGTDSWRLNGRSGVVSAPKPLISVHRGDAVTFGLQNKSAFLVPLRIGGHVVRLLHAKDDGWDPYWRDTLLLTPFSTSHVAFVADMPGQWSIESTFNAQAIGGLRGWFEVLG